MAKTHSTMLPLGTKAPSFSLIDTQTDERITLSDSLLAPATVVMFICNHCPYVIHVNAGLIQLANDYMPKGIKFYAISSNDARAYPQDGPDKMKEHAIANHYPFPYLYDEDQAIAKRYQAACTPDFFVFDSELTLVYRGQLDDARPGNDKPVTGQSVRDALYAILNGSPVSTEQTPSLGCNIKWK